MDRRLLEILCCPVSKSPLGLLQPSDRDCVNAAISAGGVKTVDGVLVQSPIRAGLLSADRKIIYRIEDDIPLLLPEDGIGTTQLNDWR
jgi:uncharacterized protein